MTDIHIPAAALEAGKRLLCLYGCGHDEKCPACNGAARAVFNAMVKAWPGVHTHEWQRQWLGGMSGTDLILPLTEKPDAE